jgi:hypothetical protein
MGYGGKWLLWSASAFTLLSACGDLTVHSFSGSVIELSLVGAGETPAGQHLELWTRDATDDVNRVPTGSDSQPYGLMVRKAITFADPCMIDAEGHLLLSPDAYQARSIGGIMQTPEQQAQLVALRIAQVTATDVCAADGSICGQQKATLLALVPYTTTSPPPFDATMAAADRLAACQAYWSDPLAYSPNPVQLTAPLHGSVYGFIAYSTLKPAAGYDGITLQTPDRLAGTRELWLTVENVPVEQVQPQGGTVILDGKPDHGGFSVIHIPLTSPIAGGPSGAAAIEANLDQDPLQL